MNHPETLSKGNAAQAKWDRPDRVHAGQMVLGTVRWQAGPRERRPKALKTKPAQEGPSGSSPLRSDGLHDGQVGGWTALIVANLLFFWEC